MNDAVQSHVRGMLLTDYQSIAYFLLWVAIRRAAKTNYDREYNERNAAHISAHRKTRYRENPGPAINRANKRYGLKGDEIKERLRVQYETDPDARQQKLDQAERWRLENPKQYTENMMRARRRNDGYPVETRPRPALCECCGRPPGARALSLDHCHETGIFRGWLCGRCNVGIGQLGDTEAGVLKAVAYLQRAYGVKAHADAA